MDKLKASFPIEGVVNLHFDDIINDNQIRTDEDLMKKLNCFKGKALEYMLIEDFSQLIITCNWAKKENGEMFCTQVEGKMDDTSLSINFETGEVYYYREGKLEKGYLEEEYVDGSISSTFHHT